MYIPELEEAKQMLDKILYCFNKKAFHLILHRDTLVEIIAGLAIILKSKKPVEILTESEKATISDLAKICSGHTIRICERVKDKKYIFRELSRENATKLISGEQPLDEKESLHVAQVALIAVRVRLGRMLLEAQNTTQDP